MEFRRRHPVVRGTRSFSWFASDGVCGTCQKCTNPFVSPTACLVPLPLDADALGMVQIPKLTSLCLCHQILFHARWIASESNCSDDPSKQHDLSQHGSREFSNNLFDSPTPYFADDSLNDGNEGAMLARPTKSVLVEPENSSRGGAYSQQHKHPL